MTDCGDAILRLSEHAGISPGYRDAWGRDQRTDDATRVALLKAMGMIGASPDAHAALLAYESHECRRELPPVAVRRQWSLPYQWEICVDESAASGALHWTLALESGEILNGELDSANPQVVRRLDRDGKRRIKIAFQWRKRLPTGYHRFCLHAPGEQVRSSMTLIIVPARCYTDSRLEGGRRIWGPAIQLYAVRSKRNWGMGDFTDLRHIVDLMGRAGAGVIGLNPMHALFPHDPGRISPYSPSSRNYLNPLYIDVEAIPEFAACRLARDQVADARFQARLMALRNVELVDFPAVAGIKFCVLRKIYDDFCAHDIPAPTPRAVAFSRFLAESGEPLQQFALYHALQDYLHSKSTGASERPAWPKEYRTSNSPAVREFREVHHREVAFFAWLQWIADQQFAACAARARTMQLRVGLYRDLAVSVDGAGAEAWTWRDMYAQSVDIGSPPDDFSPQGQNWGLPPAIPSRLADCAYSPFIATLRANMKHAGALRIDHVMGLARLFWVPLGSTPSQGAYVRYPFEDLLGILALESRRNRCMVIGEDLGTLPDGLREQLAPAGVLTYRVLFFEKESDGGFKPPSAYPEQALVAVSTHDLPTLRGYWRGRDLEMRSQFRLYPTSALRARQRAARKQDRGRLLAALKREKLVGQGAAADATQLLEMTPQLARAIHAFIARSRSWMVMVQMEDIFGQLEQVNMPATTRQYPNWRRKLAISLEDWALDGHFRKMTKTLRKLRSADSGGLVKRARPRNNGHSKRNFSLPRSTKKNKKNKGVLHLSQRNGDAQ